LSGYIRDLLSGRASDGRDDPWVAATTAQIAVHRGIDLRVVGIRVFLQQSRGGENHAGHAVSALHCTLIDEGLLDGVKRTVLSQTLNGHNALSSDRSDRQAATGDRFAVQKDGARAALPLATSVLSACESEVFAQNLEQRPVWLSFHIVPFTVDREAK
jgi:hypothetical protein